MLNQCTFIGNLGADPEVRSFQNGGKVCNLRLAVTEKWKDKTSGERKERTEWIAVAIFNDGLVGVAERYLRKGSKVLVQGKMQTRKWQDKDGNDRYSTEIVLQGYDAKLVMLDGAPDGKSNQRPDDKDTWGHGEPAKQEQGGGYDDLDDEIPF